MQVGKKRFHAGVDAPFAFECIDDFHVEAAEAEAVDNAIGFLSYRAWLFISV